MFFLRVRRGKEVKKNYFRRRYFIYTSAPHTHGFNISERNSEYAGEQHEITNFVDICLSLLRRTYLLTNMHTPLFYNCSYTSLLIRWTFTLYGFYSLYISYIKSYYPYYIVHVIIYRKNEVLF